MSLKKGIQTETDSNIKRLANSEYIAVLLFFILKSVYQTVLIVLLYLR